VRPPRHIAEPRVKAHGACTTPVVELHVLGIVSSYKTLCLHHLLRLFGVIAAMFHFPFVFLLGVGCWAKPPAEDGAGRLQNLRASSGMDVLLQAFVRGLGFVDLRASSGMQVLVQMFVLGLGFVVGTSLMLFLWFPAWISWLFWTAGYLGFLWWWSYSQFFLFGEEPVAVSLRSR